MNTAKSRLTILSNKTVKGAVRRICESLIEMADSIPDLNLSQIAIDKLSAYTSDIAVKSYVSNESRLITLVDMGIKKSAERILTESSVAKYPHLKGPISQFKKLSESNPDYLIIENYLANLKPLLWEPIVKNEYQVLEQRKINLSEDILVKSSIDVIKASRNSFIYGALIEKLEAYVMDRTTGSRKMMIQELDRYRFDTNINKLANNLRLIENSYGGFNVLSNTTKCTVKPSVGFVDIKESVDYILLDGMFYRKNGSRVTPISEAEIQKNSPSLYALNNISKTKGISLQGDSAVMFMGRDTVKIDESGTIDLNGTKLTREELKHKAAVSSIIDPAYSRGLVDVLTVHENIDKMMEIDFAKTITSNIYEGVKINVFKGQDYLVNYVNPSMNENKTSSFSSATQLKNFVWDTLSYDISESFTETLSEENREINKLQKASTNLFNRIVLIEKEIKKIEAEKATDEDVRESRTIMQLEESLHDELRGLKRKYASVSKRLNEATSGGMLPSVGDTVNVRTKGTGTVLSVDGVDKRFIVMLNNGQTIQCIDKDISIIETMVKKSKTASPEIDLQAIQGSDGKPSGKHTKVGKMVKESLNENFYGDDVDVETVSMDDVKGMTTNPSNIVKHTEFGSAYDEDMDRFNDMSAKGRDDYDPSVDEARRGYDFEDYDEMDSDSDDYDDYDRDEEDDSNWDYGDIEVEDDDTIFPDDEFPGEEEIEDIDDIESAGGPDMELTSVKDYSAPTDGEEDVDYEEDYEEDFDDEDFDDEDFDDEDFDDEDSDDDDEVEIDIDVDDDFTNEDIESAELDMEKDLEDDLHDYEKKSKYHPGYGSQLDYLTEPLDEYPEEEDELEVQFEENESEDEDLEGSYGGSIDED